MPSITGLRAFEATARNLSFTKAADEMSMTQGAISYQVKKVEELIGRQLFHRDGNELRMTDTGRKYLAAMRPILAQLMVATNQARDDDRENVLTVGCLVTFANKCLMPHLGEFLDAHAGIEVKLQTFFPQPSLPVQNLDLLITYGSEEDWGGQNEYRITREVLFPVCSPEYRDSVGGLEVPADLAKCRLIYSTSPLILRDDWEQWMKFSGHSDVPLGNRITFDHLNASYQAAIDGLGVALGRNAVIQPDLASGKLIEPFRFRMPTNLGYFLVINETRKSFPAVRAFSNWVRNQLGPRLDAWTSG